MAKKSHTEIQDFDRSTLKDKMRVFQLAKALGVASKDVVVALTELGICLLYTSDAADDVYQV